MIANKFVIIMAAGRGTRMGAPLPKQFLELEGKAILHHTLEKFEMALPQVRVVMVLPANCIEIWKDYCITRNLDTPQVIVEGGFTRFHSVRNALAQIPDGALVAVHDGVRPLVSVSMVRQMFSRLESLREEGAGSRKVSGLIPVLPMVDTLKVLRKGADGQLETVPGQWVDRNLVWGAQTPQVFWSDDLKAAYEAPYQESFTDDASVVEHHGGVLAFCEGEHTNIKITRPEDLEMAEIFLHR